MSNIYNKKLSNKNKIVNRFNERNKMGWKDTWIREGDIIEKKKITQGKAFGVKRGTVEKKMVRIPFDREVVMIRKRGVIKGKIKKRGLGTVVDIEKQKD